MRQVGFSTITLAADGAKPPVEIVVVAEGAIRISDAGDIFLSQRDADAIIAKFNDQGVEVPIDFEHATVKKAEHGDKAPAVGWITALRFETGRGLIGSVRWVGGADKHIVDGTYQYLSPVLVFDKKTRHVLELHSIALTNKPRTKDQKGLMAARDQLISILQKEDKMNDKLRKVSNALAHISLAEEVGAGIEIDVENLPDEQVDVLVQLTGAVDQLQAAMGPAAEGMTAVEVVNAATAKLGSSDEEPATESEGDAELSGAKTVTKTVKTETAANSADMVPLSTFEALQKKVIGIQDGIDEGRADELIAEAMAEGKINPNDEKGVAWYKNFAKTDIVACSAHLAGAPKVWDQSRVVTDEKGGGTPKNERERLVASAGKEWENSPEKRQGNSKKAWINCVLDEDREPKLTEGECQNITGVS